jgi:hypothetical protein
MMVTPVGNEPRALRKSNLSNVFVFFTTASSNTSETTILADAFMTVPPV